MQDDTIDALIAEVRALRIRVTQLETERDQRLPESDTTNKFVEASARDLAPNLYPTEPGTSDRATPRTTITSFSTGDRVYIKNRVRKPANWPRETAWSEERERHAIVTKIIGDQVHFVTDNGTHTWRAQNNLKKKANEDE